VKRIVHEAGARPSISADGLTGNAPSALPGARPAGKRAAALAVVFLCGIQSGCYANVPVPVQPVPGSTIVLTLNDNGRAALGPRIGASVESVEGTLDTRSDSSYTLRMTGVTFTNGQTNKWTNEQLMVPNQFVSEAAERQLSRTRTALAAGLALGSVVLFAATRGLLGLGDPGKDPGTGTGEGQ